MSEEVSTPPPENEGTAMVVAQVAGFIGGVALEAIEIVGETLDSSGSGKDDNVFYDYYDEMPSEPAVEEQPSEVTGGEEAEETSQSHLDGLEDDPQQPSSPGAADTAVQEEEADETVTGLSDDTRQCESLSNESAESSQALGAESETQSQGVAMGGERATPGNEASGDSLGLTCDESEVERVDVEESTPNLNEGAFESGEPPECVDDNVESATDAIADDSDQEPSGVCPENSTSVQPSECTDSGEAIQPPSSPPPPLCEHTPPDTPVGLEYKDHVPPLDCGQPTGIISDGDEPPISPGYEALEMSPDSAECPDDELPAAHDNYIPTTTTTTVEDTELSRTPEDPKLVRRSSKNTGTQTEDPNAILAMSQTLTPALTLAEEDITIVEESPQGAGSVTGGDDEAAAAGAEVGLDAAAAGETRMVNGGFRSQGYVSSGDELTGDELTGDELTCDELTCDSEGEMLDSYGDEASGEGLNRGNNSGLPPGEDRFATMQPRKKQPSLKSKYNTVSYRKIRKGNTRQRIDEFESMMNS